MQHFVISAFFFNDTAPPEIYPLSLHDALPIGPGPPARRPDPQHERGDAMADDAHAGRRSAMPEIPLGLGAALLAVSAAAYRSEEHTSEPQSRQYPGCRLLL